jgi:serine/threonine protein kinase
MPDSLVTDSDLLEQALSVPEARRDAWLESQLPDDARRRRRLQARWRRMAALSDRAGEDDASTVVDPLVGQTIGVWKLVERLPKQGGMSVVYRGERADGRYSQAVAVKLFESRGHSDEALVRFRREGRVLGQLRHPSTVTLLDAGASDDGRPYLVMEWVDGMSIDVYCRIRRLSLDERLRLFQRVCGAVQHAHQRTVIHRDLKPANILVTEEGQPKVLDFGLAKILDPAEFDGLVSQAGQHVGTLLYASPEQLDDTAIVTTRSDVYSLGVILYELVTGSRPFDVDAGSSRAVRRQLLYSYPDVPSVRLRDAGVPVSSVHASDLDAIVMKALRKDPDERYRSPVALFDDIERYLNGLPIDAREPTLVYRLQKLAVRHRVAVLSGGALLATGAVVGALFAFRAVRRRRREGPTR